MRKQKEKGKKNLAKILLATAIIDLIKTIIEFIKSLM